MGSDSRRSSIPGALHKIRRKSLIARHSVVRIRYTPAARLFYGSLLVLLVALVASAQAQWNILSAESEPGRGGIEHRHVIVEDAAADRRAAVDVAVFSGKSAAFRVNDHPGGT